MKCHSNSILRLASLLQGLSLAAIAFMSSPLVAQMTVQGNSLKGDWVRVDSNNDPNDQMRISISGNTATLQVVPATASRNWQVGQVLWRAIGPGGSVQVRGSDGRYYAAQITFQRPDSLHVDIQHSGAGHAQIWMVAGPTINGDWVRAAQPGVADAGTKIRVVGNQADVRFLPPTAPRSMRVGTKLWQNIQSGRLQAMASNGSYYAATVTLIGTDSLRIDSNATQLGSGHIWVRPSVAAAGPALAGPVANPNQPGSTLQPGSGTPGVPTPPATPPPGSISGAACLATSLPSDQMGVGWGWQLTTPSNDAGAQETLGVRDRVISDFTPARMARDVLTDIESTRLPGIGTGFSFVWQRKPASAGTTFERRDMNAAELDQEIQSQRSAGRRLADFEAYQRPSGVQMVLRYAGVWEPNTEGVAARLERDLTGAEYGQAFQNLRNNGYRLIDVEAYDTPAGLRYAGVWYPSCDNSNWQQLRDMTRAELQAELPAKRGQGFLVVDLESYEAGGSQRYAAIWQRIPGGRSWAVRTDRELKQFLNHHYTNTDLGMRLIDFEAYETAGGVRYAGVWAENSRRYDMPFRAELERDVRNYRRAHDIPGISVAVIQDGEVIYRGGFGWADSLEQKVAHSGTAYLTASVSKVIAATLAARLEDQGLIDLTRPTSDFLPNLPSHHTHTLEQLLSKTGCIWHYNQGPEPDESVFYTRRLPAVEEMQDSPLLSGCTPGGMFHYSTHGYTFVGAALEEALDLDLSDIIDQYLARPFGLATIRPLPSGNFGGFGAVPVRPYQLARGYIGTSSAAGQGTSTPANYENTSWKVLGGGLQASALDLARFGALTLDNSIADTTRLWTQMTSGLNRWNPTAPVPSAAPNVGLAWRLGTANGGRRIAQHRGTSDANSGGARSHLRIYRDDGLVIAILTNQLQSGLDGSNHPVRSLSSTIAATVFANPPPP